MLFAFCLQVLAFDVKAQSRKNEVSGDVYDAKQDDQRDFTPKSKIAPDLEEEVSNAYHGLRRDGMQQVIIQLKPAMETQ